MAYFIEHTVEFLEKIGDAALIGVETEISQTGEKCVFSAADSNADDDFQQQGMCDAKRYSVGVYDNEGMSLLKPIKCQIWSFLQGLLAITNITRL